MPNTLGDLDGSDDDRFPPTPPTQPVREVKPVEMYGHQGAPLRKDFRAIVLPAEPLWMEPTDADLKKIEQQQTGQGVLDLGIFPDPADLEADKLAKLAQRSGQGNA